MTAGPNEAEVARVRQAVIEAGRIAMRFFRQEHKRWEKGPGQIVTEADVAVDRYLHAQLRHDHASDGWLSEETEDDRVRLERRRVWVVDPIDGTRSFAEGKPEFTISVALLVHDLGALVERLRAAGVELVDDEPLEGYDRVYAYDPFGNRLELLEPNAG